MFEFMKDVMEAVSEFSVVDLYPSIGVLEVLTGFRKKIDKLHREVDRILENIVTDHRDKITVVVEEEKIFIFIFIDDDDNSSDDYKDSEYKFIAFSGGRRICQGITFGAVDVEFTLACLLFHFDWKVEPNGNKPEELDMAESFGLSVRKYDLELIPITYHSPVTNKHQIPPMIFTNIYIY
ncbi:hypothetical protein Ahy_B07g088803 isoform B [Arachis hypogaea]|uniref:Cytochrome P450 n=1 Tax=Arachis hypogaea TaxID=3818 RepID=A0A444YFI9_ARAHY|nr:hypothetical protein Ahy_B07g088803 isoform B [Arachis hypogaea]